MKKTLAGVVALWAALGSGEAQEAREALVWTGRRVEVGIHENLAIVRFEYSVVNQTAGSKEGEIEFRVPPGAAVFEATLVKNVSSRDRISKLVPAVPARRAYEAMKKEGRAIDPVRETAEILALANAFRTSAVTRAASAPSTPPPAPAPAPAPPPATAPAPAPTPVPGPVT